MFGHLLTENNRLIFFATRLQGLAVAPNNPKKIYSILDIASRKAKFINRREGTGTRILFDQMLDVLAVKPEEIEGYNDISDTQFFTAVQIAAGKVDVGLCTANVAKENGLDFIPLAKEVYYLAADAKFLETKKKRISSNSSEAMIGLSIRNSLKGMTLPVLEKFSRSLTFSRQNEAENSKESLSFPMT